MRKLFFIVISILTINSVFAQNDTLLADSCTAHKNEIGINLIPAAAPLMIGNGEFYDVALTYKRHLNNGALRFRLNYTADYSFHHLPPYENSTVFEKNDTMTSIFDFHKNPACYGISIGYEKHRKGKWTTDFFGADINFNLNMIEYETDSRKYFNDTVLVDKHIDYALTYMYRIGFNLFYGLKIPVADQFALSVQFGADFGYYFGDFAYPDEKYYLVTKSTESFHLNKYFINDFSLTFCF